MVDHSGGVPQPSATQAALDTDAARIGAELVRMTGGTDPFAAAVRATRMPMIVTDPRQPDNPVVFANDSFCRLTGYSRGEIVGRNCRFLQGPETEPATVKRIRAAVDARESIEIDIRNHRKDGTPFWNRLLLAPVRDAAGELAYFFASQVDVTLERERMAGLESRNAALMAEVADRLRAQELSEARLARLLATVPAGIVEVGADGRVVYANPAAGEMLGAAPDDLLGQRHDDPAWQVRARDGTPFPPDRRPVAAALRGEVVKDVEQAVTARDGRQAVLLVDAVPISSHGRGGAEAGQLDGRPLGALAAFQDVTARHHAMQALRDSEERYRTLFEAIDAGFCIVELRIENGRGVDYQFVEVNPAFEKQTGLVNAASRWMRDLVPGLEPHWAEIYGRVALTGVPVRFENAAEAMNRWFDVHAFRTGDPAQRRVAILFNDISDRRRAELDLRRMNETLEARVAARTAELTQAVDALHAEALERAKAEDALRQSQKMEAVGQLTGGIAHDFNNMLQAIGGGLELMKRRLEQGRLADASRFVDSARQTVGRAAALTHRLLAFARRQALQPKPVETDALIGGMAELLRQTVGPAVVLDLRLGDGAWSVLCDPNGLENVLLNLAINARDAMPGGGRVTIGTRDVVLGPAEVSGQDGAEAGDYVEFAVSDTGTGMDAATLDRAFEPFFTTKPIGQGTGLGLSQAYGFARQSDGLMRLDSAPGQGTTVRLYLPRHGSAEQAAEPAAPDREQHRAGAGEVVLLVEDQGDVRAVAAERLREVGYKVMEAADGPAALLLLRKGARVDLLVTDVGLPGGLNGRQVADAAREQAPVLPVLFITGYAGSVLEGQLAPGMAVIGKPFTLDKLAAQVRSMLDAAPAL